LRIFRGKNQVDFSFLAQFKVTVQVPWIFPEILSYAKLRGIHEDGKNNDVGPVSQQVDKGQVTFM
jgi:hypothetical protein